MQEGFPFTNWHTFPVKQPKLVEQSFGVIGSVQGVPEVTHTGVLFI